MYYKTSMKCYKYSEVYVLRISKKQKETLSKIKSYGFNTQKFVIDAIREKIERERKDLKLKEPKQWTPFD